jgi:hypothetical protein
MDGWDASQGHDPPAAIPIKSESTSNARASVLVCIPAPTDTGNPSIIDREGPSEHAFGLRSACVHIQLNVIYYHPDAAAFDLKPQIERYISERASSVMSDAIALHLLSSSWLEI